MIIVDDEEGICKGLRDLDWNSLRIEVKGIFSNGLAAYQYIMEEAVDIVLTDIKMPIIDGLELSKMLEED